MTSMNDEIWKQIPDFSNYEISSYGNIRNKSSRKHLSQGTLRGGYIRSKLKNDDNKYKSLTIHRIVAMTFIPNLENKSTVNHINHNKLDNRVENLEWASTTEQNRHKRKVPRDIQRLISSRKVWRIDVDTNNRIQLYETIRDASKWVFDNNLTSVENFDNGNNIKTRICAVCRKKRNQSYGYKWEYDDRDDEKFKDEIWKSIPKELIDNKEGFYISTYGRLKNKTGRISEGYNKPNDYKWCSISPKQYLLHRLVATVFLPNWYNKNIVNHKDGNKANSKLYNLEWVTSQENSQHAIDTVLNPCCKKIRCSFVQKNKNIVFDSIASFCRFSKVSESRTRYALKNKSLLQGKYSIEYI